MASPRAPGKRRVRKKSPRLFPGLAWAAAVFGLIGAAVTLIYLLSPSPRTGAVIRPPFEESQPHPQPRPAPPPAVVPKPQETLPPLPEPSSQPPTPPRPRESKKTTKTPIPRVAILIDDMGYDLNLDEAFIRLEAPISFAFLPSAPYTCRLANKAGKLRRDILVHLPLEPTSSDVDPGPGVLRLSMDLEHMLPILKRDLDSVPGAKGVNNHMGSKFTADRRAMESVLGEVRRRGMFFVDSLTTQDSLGYDTARSMGIPALERTVFLDHTLEPSAIDAQIDRLIEISRTKGHALAIGHPQAHTLEVLRRELPKIRKEAKIVPLHELLVSDKEIP